MVVDNIDTFILEHMVEKVITAEEIAEQGSFSTRTVYRRINKLRGMGLKISAGAGMGFRLKRSEWERYLQMGELAAALVHLNEVMAKIGMKPPILIGVDPKSLRALRARPVIEGMQMIPDSSVAEHEAMVAGMRFVEIV